MHQNTTPERYGLLPCLIIVVPLFFLACRPVRFVQDYDDTTERRLLQIQDKCARLFVRLERDLGTNEAAVAKFTDLYEDVRTDIDVLQVRNMAIAKSEVTREQLVSLRNEMDRMEILHKAGFHDLAEVMALKEGIETTLVSMQKFQFSLKNRMK